MPPASSPDRAARVRFRRAVTLMLMTLVLPGSAQLVAGNKQVGRVAMRIFFALLVTGGFLLLLGTLWHRLVLEMMFSSFFVGLFRWVLMLAAVGWAYLFVDAWRLGQPLTLMRKQRLAVVGLNGVLCFGVAGSLLFGAHLARSGQVLLTIFPDGEASAATHGRYNVLLMGGDSGAGRWGLRPDSLTVASIDADSGRTVLIGLPRNMANFRFAEDSVMAEQFPDGFDCDGCYLNGVSTWAGDNTELFGDSENPGIDATVSAVEGITGLTVNYWALVDLQGFKDVVDAVGGVKVTVRDRIPIGLPGDEFHGYIEPGRKKLNGFHALWFARARDGSDDYSRMARQKCMMNALLTQVSPQKALRNFSELADATKGLIETNLPQEAVADFVDLAMKARSQKIATLSLVPPAINTGNPDLDKIRSMVDGAIDKAEGKAGRPAKRKKAGSTTGGSIGNLKDGYAANQADDLASAC